ncbi:probable carbohydrate esterase At4g34215 [Momordica charantia]|uniref:Probable carbohydrate esterase At4g34215 n=1 Tax=Momordica charantia TaxID=3673 RepID=A0A6J1BYJ2_MOMCH|nr:probable carbohydrate esterase At4g34215 [Momordica charantia]
MADFISSLILLCFILMCFSEATSPPDNIFILGGQSNMAGRGGVTCDNTTMHYCKWDGYIPVESQSETSIIRFTAGRQWELAHEPLHWDIDRKKTNGVGPGMAFANELLAKANKSIGVIGLVPCAIGGTYLREWVKGTINYTKLVDRINASEIYGGKVQAFFWFQGESDASVRVDAEFYKQNLAKFLTDLRKDLNRPKLPIILVKITTYDTLISPIMNYTQVIRRADEAVKHKLPKISTVDAKKAIQRVVSHQKPGLNEDKGHLSVYSEVEVGKMLAHAYLQKFA